MNKIKWLWRYFCGLETKIIDPAEMPLNADKAAELEELLTNDFYKSDVVFSEGRWSVNWEVKEGFGYVVAFMAFIYVCAIPLALIDSIAKSDWLRFGLALAAGLAAVGFARVHVHGRRESVRKAWRKMSSEPS